MAILHDLDLAAAMADRVVLLDAGRVAALGRPIEVLTVSEVERVFKLAVDVIERPDHRGPMIVPRLPRTHSLHAETLGEKDACSLP